jgi:hypothetical protein
MARMAGPLESGWPCRTGKEEVPANDANGREYSKANGATRPFVIRASSFFRPFGKLRAGNSTFVIRHFSFAAPLIRVHSRHSRANTIHTAAYLRYLRNPRFSLL